jgi:hypothetical protein
MSSETLPATDYYADLCIARKELAMSRRNAKDLDKAARKVLRSMEICHDGAFDKGQSEQATAFAYAIKCIQEEFNL